MPIAEIIIKGIACGFILYGLWKIGSIKPRKPVDHLEIYRKKYKARRIEEVENN